MGAAAVSIDLTTAPGLVASAITELVPGGDRTLIELAGLMVLSVRIAGDQAIAVIGNPSPAVISWSDAVARRAGVLEPGAAAELPIPMPGELSAPPASPLCLQMAAGAALALTVTVSVLGHGCTRRVLAQALVSG